MSGCRGFRSRKSLVSSH
uniref:Uncharacterized protein n=1 Tax=Anguilla anguilla TaxID=7936 RepID=A0A0E9S5H6_ANGAN